MQDAMIGPPLEPHTPTGREWEIERTVQTWRWRDGHGEYLEKGAVTGSVSGGWCSACNAEKPSELFSVWPVWASSPTNWSSHRPFLEVFSMSISTSVLFSLSLTLSRLEREAPAEGPSVHPALQRYTLSPGFPRFLKVLEFQTYVWISDIWPQRVKKPLKVLESGVHERVGTLWVNDSDREGSKEIKV